MTNNDFFNYLDILTREDNASFVFEDDPSKYEEFMLKYNEFKSANESKTVLITEKGIEIIEFMKQNEEAHKNIFTAKFISDSLGKSNSRQVSGVMTKLCNDGYCSKTKGNPTCYHLENKGREFIA